MNRLSWLFLLPILLFAACSENIDEEDTEYADWQQRNAAFFQQKMAEAKTAIAVAKAQYGDAWEANCNYRIFRRFDVGEQTTTTLTDSICVEIVEHGEGAESPFYTDSVQVNYLKRLMPTDKYPEGRIIDHSGYTVNYDDIFSPYSAAVAAKAVAPATSGTIYTLKGETTAFLQMRLNDHWRIYIPQELAYGANSSSVIPSYSTVIVEARLKAFYRAGTAVKR